MSRALATGGIVYLVSAMLLLIGILFFVRRDIERTGSSAGAANVVD
jgi:hypothetical protein